MSLQTRLASLISAIGTDIKALNTALATKAPLGSPVFTDLVHVEGTSPRVQLKDTDAGTDLKIFRIWTSNGSTYLWCGMDDGATTKQYVARIWHADGRVDFDAAAPVPRHGTVNLVKENNPRLARNIDEATKSGASTSYSTAVYAKIDSTNLRASLTLPAGTSGRVRLSIRAQLRVATNGSKATIRPCMDGNTVVGPKSMGMGFQAVMTNHDFPLMMWVDLDGISAGTHTFEWEWHSSSGTISLITGSANDIAIVTAEEIQ